MLIEMFFLDNRLDVAWYKSGGQSKLAEGMAGGLIAAGRAIGTGTGTQPSGNGTFTPSDSWLWPLAGKSGPHRITNPFGSHDGLDMNIGYGEGATVIAAHDGKVLKARELPPRESYGTYVFLDAGNGVISIYAHMIKGSLKVQEGDIVKKGDALGLLGNTGNSRGAHLHFEVRKNGTIVNPGSFLPPKP
jgi:murein DD-endopeptidase MepM/ murein hydrolase activator NlpD